MSSAKWQAPVGVLDEDLQVAALGALNCSRDGLPRLCAAHDVGAKRGDFHAACDGSGEKRTQVGRAPASNWQPKAPPLSCAKLHGGNCALSQSWPCASSGRARCFGMDRLVSHRSASANPCRGGRRKGSNGTGPVDAAACSSIREGAIFAPWAHSTTPFAHRRRYRGGRQAACRHRGAHAADQCAGARCRARRPRVPESGNAAAHRLVQVPRRL